MSILATSIYYRLLHSMRVKQAIFFSTIFPLLLFVIFSSIWGGVQDPEYNYFLLTGIVGATLASEGLYAIGAVVKNYYDSKLIRFFRVTPINIVVHFLSMAISRLVFVSLTIFLLFILAFFMHGLQLSLSQMGFLVLGLVVGMLLFSAFGLMVSFANIREKGASSLFSSVYFILVFISNAYYPLKLINPGLNQFANVLPLNHLLNIIRGEDLLYSSIYCAVSTVVFALVFRFLFKRYQLIRS